MIYTMLDNMMKKVLFFVLCINNLCLLHAQVPTQVEVKQCMKLVADWQINHMKEVTHGELNWVNATFYLGLSRWAAIAEQDSHDDSYYKWLMRLGRRNYWQVDQRMYHADDICISQTYLSMYDKYKEREMLVPTLARAEWVIMNPPVGSFELDYSDATTLEHWTWCDALFMAPPVYLHLYNITGDKKFIRFMDKEYKLTYDYLFDKEENLFYRDHRYFDKKEANGAKVFWGRGNGWVLGGLVEMLRELPVKSKYRPFYQELFQKMCRRYPGYRILTDFGMLVFLILLLIRLQKLVVVDSLFTRWLMESTRDYFLKNNFCQLRSVDGGHYFRQWRKTVDWVMCNLLELIRRT